MADERSIFDKLFEGVDIEKYYPSNWSGEDIWNTISPFAVSQMGKDEDVGAIYNRLSPEEKQAFHDRQKGINVTTEKPFMSVSRTGEPPSKASSMPTKEDIISRLLAPKRGEYPPSRPTSRISRVGTSQATPPPTAADIKSRLLAPKRGEYPPQTATQTVPSPINKRRAATLKLEQQSMPKIVTEDIANQAKKLREKEKARKTRKAVGTLLKERQTAPSKEDIRSGEKAETRRKIAAAKKKRYQPSTASEIAKTKETRKAVGTMLKDRQTAPDEVVIESARKAEAKRKAAKLKRQAALEATASPERPSRKVTKVKPVVVKTEKKPVVVKKVAKEKKPTPIEADLGTGRKAHTVKSGQTLSGIAKQHGTTLKALLAANPKLKGRPNLIKVGEKIKIRGPLKKAASPYKGMTKKEWEKVTTASKKQREQRSARKTGGIVKKAGGGRMKQVGLHTAEMRSAGKDLHQPQSKIKKRIHEETTYAKKGGQVGKKKKVGKKEQGYKARKDESIAMRVKKKRTKKQLKASRNESYGKWGKGKGKGKINRFGDSLVASTYD